MFEHKTSFILGSKKSIPLVFSASFFGLIFGFTGASGGLPLYFVSAMSYIIFAGSAQFIALVLIIQNEEILAIVLAALILNLRHLLYGAVLNKSLKFEGLKKLIPAYFLTDETFLVTTLIERKLNDDQKNEISMDWVSIGAGLTLWTSWNISTILGFLLYSVLSDEISLPQNFVIAASFIGFLLEHFVNYKEDRPIILITALLSILLGLFTSSSILLIVVMVFGAFMAMVMQWRRNNV